jgi:hypothetical protein
MNRLFIFITVFIFFIGCTSQSKYESSAHEMLRDEYPQSNYGFLKSWNPTGKSYEYQLSENEIEKSSVDLESCIKQLSLKYIRPPKEVLRSLQIVKCMEAKGWHLEIEEILIMQ